MGRAIVIRKPVRSAAVIRYVSISDYLRCCRSHITANKAMRATHRTPRYSSRNLGNHSISGPVILSEAKHLGLFPLPIVEIQSEILRSGQNDILKWPRYLEQLQCLCWCLDDLVERLAQAKRGTRRVIEIVVIENHMYITRFL